MLDKLDGFDDFMESILRDWNAPGLGVGVVKDGELVFAKGYGYRDYENKLPFTPTTLCPIASNSKLFTAVAAGLLVEEGKLTWDKPIRDAVPSIRFYDNSLNDNVTLRDMLAHRTGITRHDYIWYKADFTSKELFERLKYMKPVEPLRQKLIYNNMMYEAVGYIIELISGKTWPEFVRERILDPLTMADTVFTIADMQQRPDFSVPFSEKRDSKEIHKTPYFDDKGRSSPAGGIISNVQEMSRWLIAIMNEGMLGDKQVVPKTILKATLEPAVAEPNVAAEVRGFWELLNTTYGMGRRTATYRGHLYTYHGGVLDGFYSQVSYMPREQIGVVTLVIGQHCAPLSNLLGYNIYERLLGLDQTPWSERMLDIVAKMKEEDTIARSKVGAQHVPNTHPSHAISDYAGAYEHQAYGVLNIGLIDGVLQYDFREALLPLVHFHYDRFDTPDDEIHGKSSINFLTNPMGDIDRAVMSLDQAEVVFCRRPDAPSEDVLRQLAGTYENLTGFKFQVTLDDGVLWLDVPSQPKDKMLPYKVLQFRMEKFSDNVFEFIREGGEVKSLKQTVPSGEYLYKRI